MNDALLKLYSALQIFVDGFGNTASLPWVLDIDSCIVLRSEDPLVLVINVAVLAELNPHIPY